MTSPADPANNDGATRRNHDRREAVIPADAIGPDSFGDPKHRFTCSIVDISQGGVALLSRKVLAPGDKVYLRIDKLGGKTIYGVQVKNVRYREGHGHISGCAWLPKSEWRPSVDEFDANDA